MTRRDARHYGFHVEYLFGPIRVPSREDFVDALTKIAGESPLLRVGAEVTSDRRSRVQDPERLREWAERVVEVVPGDGYDHFVQGFASRAIAPPNAEVMHFTLTDRHVLFNGDHSLGDSGILMRMAPAVIAVANGEPIPKWLMRPEPTHVLVRALWETFGRHPRQLRTALTTRGPAWDPAEASELKPWTPEPAISIATLTNARFGALRRAYKVQSSRVPATIAMLMLARVALQAESIDVSPISWVPVDARRWLPDGVDMVGNFAPEVLVSTVGGATAIDLSEQLASAVESGRPLLSMSLSSMRRSTTFHIPTQVPVRPRADVSVTTLGLRQEVDGLPWIDRSDAWFCASGPDPDPVAIRCAITPTRTGATVTASYHSNVFSREQVDAALARLTTGDIAELVELSAVTTA